MDVTVVLHGRYMRRVSVGCHMRYMRYIPLPQALAMSVPASRRSRASLASRRDTLGGESRRESRVTAEAFEPSSRKLHQLHQLHQLHAYPMR